MCTETLKSGVAKLLTQIYYMYKATSKWPILTKKNKPPWGLAAKILVWLTTAQLI